MATLKQVQKLTVGDRIALSNGAGVVTKVERSRIIEAAPGNCGAYELEWKDEAGEIGAAIAAGADEIETV